MTNAFDMDVHAVRSRYQEAIGAYRDAAAHLEAARPQVPVASFGAGFTAEGQRINQALEALHAVSHEFLDARTRNWEQVIELADATAAVDEANSESFRAVEQP